MLVGEVMQADPPCVEAHRSVVVAARTMAEHDLAQLPVCTSGGRFLGMLGQEDVVRRCVAAGLDPERTTVAELVEPGAPAVQAQATVEEALLAVLHTGSRCLAVLQGGRLVGTVSQACLVEVLPDETVGGILAVVSDP